MNRVLFQLGLSVFLAISAPAQSPARALGDAFADVYEKTAPSVVVLEVVRREEGEPSGMFAWELLFPDRSRRSPEQTEESEASGFIIREDGYILTNAHVIAGADAEDGVIARRQNGSRLPLKIVGIDDKTDLAVLKAAVEGLPAVEWGDSSLVRVGEFVCGIGAPFELDYTLTVGVLSAKGRSNLTSTVYEDYLQTDAAINPGNSGGPLCDIDGRVVGVNTLINGLSRGLSFAIPSNLARTVSAELIAHGRVARPWLGIRIETLSQNPALQKIMGRDNGVLVRSIEEDAPASRSVLQPADVIVEVDGQPVLTARELQQMILGKKIGQEVRLRVWRRGVRDGAYETVSVTTEELPSSPAVATASSPTAPFRPPPPNGKGERDQLGVLGLGLQNLPDAVAKALGLATNGVIVTNVEQGSPAELAGLQRRDVVTAIGSYPVEDKESFLAALASLEADEAAVLLVERQGKKTYAILKE